MGLGYFLFGHISMRVNMENMQARTTKVICSPTCPEGKLLTRMIRVDNTFLFRKLKNQHILVDQLKTFVTQVFVYV